ncbi:MAG: PAS domain S-box protein [Myxococcales bacterium]|nr:PAS domain S-box protein [Myxococcales bacterium]
MEDRGGAASSAEGDDTLARLQLAALDAVANAIVFTDARGTIFWVNAAWASMTGYSRDEVIGQNPRILKSGAQDKAFYAELWRTVLAGRVWRGELINRRKDGSTYHEEETITPLCDAAGKVTHFVAIKQDISERKRVEQRLRESEERALRAAQELTVAKERAESADKIKSAFLATMSHELRTPLNSIIGFTGILLQGMAGPINPEQKKQLQMVRDSSRHLLALINDVLDISKIEAGQLEVRCEPFELSPVIERAVASVRPRAEQKGLALEVSAPAGLAPVSSDARRVEQVLLNLLSNAVKFTDHGRVSLEVAADAERVSMTVRDTGVGIRPQDLAALFQPFRQLDTGLSRNHEGTGLGLAICRRLAELMGGEVRAESEWGGGSAFTFVLPRRRGAP